MSDAAELLAQLRDVREPLPPEGVSLWLIGANAAALCLIILLLWHRQHQRKYAWRKQVLEQLRQAHNKPPQESIGIAASALRKLMIYRGYRVETLSGKPWLQQLDDAFDTHWFSSGNGRLFGDALYQPAIANHQNTDNIIKELETLIAALPANTSDNTSNKVEGV